MTTARRSFTIKKLQDAYDCDLDLSDTVGSIFEGESDVQTRMIKVVPTFINRDFSVPATSNLRPVAAQKRVREISSEHSSKRRRLEEEYRNSLDTDPARDRPVPSTESQHGDDEEGTAADTRVARHEERARRSESGGSLTVVRNSQTGLQEFGTQVKEESPELGDPPQRTVPESLEQHFKKPPLPAPQVRAPSSPPFMRPQTKPGHTYGRSTRTASDVQREVDLLNDSRGRPTSAQGSECGRSKTQGTLGSNARSFQLPRPDEIESTPQEQAASVLPLPSVPKRTPIPLPKNVSTPSAVQREVHLLNDSGAQPTSAQGRLSAETQPKRTPIPLPENVRHRLWNGTSLSNGATRTANITASPPPTKRRGRPPKNAAAIPGSNAENGTPKRRGRPPKNAAATPGPNAENGTQKRRGRPPKDAPAIPGSNAKGGAPKRRGRPPKNTASVEKEHGRVMSKIFPRGIDQARKDIDFGRQVFEDGHAHLEQSMGGLQEEQYEPDATPEAGSRKPGSWGIGAPGQQDDVVETPDEEKGPKSRSKSPSCSASEGIAESAPGAEDDDETAVQAGDEADIQLQAETHAEAEAEAKDDDEAVVEAEDEAGIQLETENHAEAEEDDEAADEAQDGAEVQIQAEDYYQDQEDDASKSQSPSAANSTRSSPAVSRQPARFLTHSPTPEKSSSEEESEASRTRSQSQAASSKAASDKEVNDSDNDTSSSDESEAEDEDVEMADVKTASPTADAGPLSSPPELPPQPTPRVPATQSSQQRTSQSQPLPRRTLIEPPSVKTPTAPRPAATTTTRSFASSQSVSQLAAARRTTHSKFPSIRQQLSSARATPPSAQAYKRFDPRTSSLGRLTKEPNRKAAPFGQSESESEDESSSSSSSEDEGRATNGAACSVA